MEKEFLKLSRSRLDKLINQYKYIQRESDELSNDLRHLSEEKWGQLFPQPAYWSLFYELSYLDHLTMFLYCIGILPTFKTALKAEDPIEATLKIFDDIDEKSIDEHTLPDGIPMSLFFVCFYSMLKTLKSWVVYGQTLSKLTEHVREGSYKALYKAVQIDPAYIGCPSAMHLMSRAILERKRGFPKKLGEAMRSNRGYYREEFEPLRFILTALAETGDLVNMTHNERYELFCEELKLYKTDDKDDPYGSLKQFIFRWKQTAEVYGKAKGT